MIVTYRHRNGDILPVTGLRIELYVLQSVVHISGGSTNSPNAGKRVVRSATA